MDSHERAHSRFLSPRFGLNDMVEEKLQQLVARCQPIASLKS